VTEHDATPTSTRLLHVPVGQELSKAEVLQVWEQLRQEVARALTGDPGVFPGYDDLEWHLPTSGGQEVLVSAHAVEVFERRHVVDYNATLVRNAGDGDQGPLLAHGRGLSLVLTDQHFGEAHA
jgi:hypothetical protein